MKVLSINQYLIVDEQLSLLFDVDSTLFVVDMLEGIVNLVVHFCYSIYLFFSCRGEEYVVVIKVQGVRVKAVETSVRGECVGSGASRIVSKFSER